MKDPRILVVDDSADIAESLAFYLNSRLMVDVVFCGLPSAAYEIVDRTPQLKLVITDYDLRDHDNGIDVIRKIAQDRSDLHFILMSSMDLTFAHRALQSMPVQFFSKPFNPDDLIKVVEEMLSRRLENDLSA